MTRVTAIRRWNRYSVEKASNNNAGVSGKINPGIELIVIEELNHVCSIGVTFIS